MLGWSGVGGGEELLGAKRRAGNTTVALKIEAS